MGILEVAIDMGLSIRSVEKLMENGAKRILKLVGKAVVCVRLC